MITDIKLLLGLSLADSSADQTLTALQRVMLRKVKNYCNIEAIPAELDLTVCEMVAALYKVNYAYSVSAVTTSQTGAIKKETIGDYSVEYDVGSAQKSSGSSAAETILNDYKGQLNLFRKLRL